MKLNNQGTGDIMPRKKLSFCPGGWGWPGNPTPVRTGRPPREVSSDYCGGIQDALTPRLLVQQLLLELRIRDDAILYQQLCQCLNIARVNNLCRCFSVCSYV